MIPGEGMQSVTVSQETGGVGGGGRSVCILCWLVVLPWATQSPLNGTKVRASSVRVFKTPSSFHTRNI